MKRIKSLRGAAFRWGFLYASIELNGIYDDGSRGNMILIVDDLLPCREALFLKAKRDGGSNPPGGRLIVLSDIGTKNDLRWKDFCGSVRSLFKPVRRASLRQALVSEDTDDSLAAYLRFPTALDLARRSSRSFLLPGIIRLGQSWLREMVVHP
jgi:hypothetical protein